MHGGSKQRRRAAIGYRTGSMARTGPPCTRQPAPCVASSAPTSPRGARPWSHLGRAEGGQDDLAGLRDRTLFLLGLAGALRRAELVGIDREQLRPAATSLRLRLPQSKGDQAGERVELGIPRGKPRDTVTKPARALEACSSARRRFGPVFRKVDQWGKSNMPGSAHRTPVAAGAARRLRHGGVRGRRPRRADHARQWAPRPKTMHGYVRRARIETPRPPDPILRRPCADREEKRVTYGNGSRRRNSLTPTTPIREAS